MNANKMARIESGLSSMAKKVLGAVPLQEVWTKSQIADEMRRIGITVDRNMVYGCLSTIVESGLIKEPERGSFIRVTVRTAAKQTQTTTQENPVVATTNTIRASSTATSPATMGTDTLTRLANLGALLRRAAEECDAIALEVEARVQAAGKEGEKLRQLTALLKDIGA